MVTIPGTSGAMWSPDEPSTIETSGSIGMSASPVAIGSSVTSGTSPSPACNKIVSFYLLLEEIIGAVND